MGRSVCFDREPGSKACAGVPIGSALARGAGSSRMATMRAHVLKAAAETVWHQTVVQVLVLLHRVAEVNSACGSTVSGRDSTAWRYAWMRATCSAMRALLPPVVSGSGVEVSSQGSCFGVGSPFYRHPQSALDVTRLPTAHQFRV